MADVARSSLFDNADRTLDGELATLLLEWRADGLTLADITWELRTREVTVSHETVRAWINRVTPTGDAA